jgi:phosphoribosylaminoimidazole carboxylase (NCAIR synthetase)
LHNSGHQTQEGNANSQFEQFYRVLKNLPLADTDAFGFSGMLNLVGEENYSGKVKYEGLEEVLKFQKPTFTSTEKPKQNQVEKWDISMFWQIPEKNF